MYNYQYEWSYWLNVIPISGDVEIGRDVGSALDLIFSWFRIYNVKICLLVWSAWMLETTFELGLTMDMRP